MAERNRLSFIQDFTFETKQRKRKEAYDTGIIPVGTRSEIHHRVPKYVGGTSDEENADALSIASHGETHLISFLYPELELNQEAEWMATRQIFARTTIPEGLEFLIRSAKFEERAKQLLKEKIGIRAFKMLGLDDK